MNRRPRYGNVALGVECALPAADAAPGRARRIAHWLLAALRRWA